MKKSYILILTFFLIGCGEQGYYSAAGITEEKIAKDIYDCRTEISNLTNQVFRLEDLERPCMEAKGYKFSKDKPKAIEEIAEVKKESKTP